MSVRPQLQALLLAARVTVFFNGVLVQNAVALAGPTRYIGKPGYQQPQGPSPIKLQAHGDKSEPLASATAGCGRCEGWEESLVAALVGGNSSVRRQFLTGFFAAP